MAKHKRQTESEKRSHALVERFIKWVKAQIKTGPSLDEVLVAAAADIHINSRTLRYWYDRTHYPRSLPLVVALENFLTLKEA